MAASNGLLISDFLGYLKFDCRADDETVGAHEQTLAHLAEWLESLEAGLRLPNVTRIMLQLYIGDSLNQGTGIRKTARRLSHLRRFFGFLVNEEQIEKDPTFWLAMPKHCSRTKAKDRQHSAALVTWVRVDWDAYLL
jgi:integrase/recombinase XerD